MTLKALEQEIVTAVEGDSKNNRETALHDALAIKLMEITTLSQVSSTSSQADCHHLALVACLHA